MTRKARPGLFFLVAATFFLIANRGAYKGYFSDDELENIALSRTISAKDFLEGLLTPRYFENNFRPVGELYFRVMTTVAGLKFPPYVASLHFVHLGNVVLLWLVLRRLSLSPWVSAAGALVFAFHMAAFDIYWKPMYVFDLLCGTFCLLSLLFWLDDRWILSLLAFWLAYRSKEVAVMLPVVLAAYELLFGKARWTRLIPFFAISAWFGIRGLLVASHITTEYEFHYTPAAIFKSAGFYLSKLTLVTAGHTTLLIVILVLLAVLLVAARDRTVWFGAIMFATLLVPMLLMSERLFSAYLYVPLIGFAIAIAGVGTHQRAAVIALALACWIPWNYANLRSLRREVLSHVDDRRRYLDGLAELIDSQPGINSFLYHDGPVGSWGVRAFIRYRRPESTAIEVFPEDSDDAQSLIRQPALAVLHWNRISRRLQPVLRTPGTPDATYINVGPLMEVWQLGTGWFQGGDFSFRWTSPHATAHLRRPEGATGFELIVNVGGEYIARLHRARVEVSINGHPIGSAEFDSPELHTVRWKVNPAPPGEAEFAIDSSPPFPAEKPLGIAVVAFGFY